MGLKTKMHATCDQCGKEEDITVEFNDFVEIGNRQLLTVDFPDDWSFKRSRWDDREVLCRDCSGRGTYR